MVCPADSHTRYVVERGLKEGFADFVLVCAGECTPDFAAMKGQYPGRVEIIIEPTNDGAARRAVAMVRAGEADVLIAVLSHVTATYIPAYGKMLVFADAAVIPRPTLEQFDAILGYSAGVSRVLGTACPRVALINFTEKVSDKFPHTLYYMELKRRASEARYGDVLVDGPMDVKTALDTESGQIKGMSSPVVGSADVLVFPNIESGNVFYKTLTLFAGAETAGMLCGTTAPVVVASRADSCESKFYSLAMACVMHDS